MIVERETEHRLKRLLELKSDRDGNIDVSMITQAHIQKRFEGKYRKEEAEELMTYAAGKIGEIREVFYNAGRSQQRKRMYTENEIVAN